MWTSAGPCAVDGFEEVRAALRDRLGAARLAQAAVDGGDPASVCAAPPVAQVVEPDPQLIDILSTKKQRFRDAYPRITPNPKGF